jgi:hypothetical protein
LLYGDNAGAVHLRYGKLAFAYSIHTARSCLRQTAWPPRSAVAGWSQRPGLPFTVITAWHVTVAGCERVVPVPVVAVVPLPVLLALDLLIAIKPSDAERAGMSRAYGAALPIGGGAGGASIWRDVACYRQRFAAVFGGGGF